jgi:hypothetical protein
MVGREASAPRHAARRSLYYKRDEQPEYHLDAIDERTFALDGYRKFRLRFVAGPDGAIEKVVGVYFNGRTDGPILEETVKGK